MVRIGRRQTPPASIQTELQRLQAIRLAAEQELGRLRAELGERVASVERRERELADALARVGKTKLGKQRVAVSAGNDEALQHAQVGLAARAQDLGQREADLAAREQALIKLETDLARRAAGDAAEAAKPDARLAQIEARLKALQEAEKAFARTQAELATASDDLVRRELALAERERAIEGGAATGPAGSGMSRSDLDDLDDRLRRLEQETRAASTERTFGDGLRTLERKGVRGKPPES